MYAVKLETPTKAKDSVGSFVGDNTNKGTKMHTCKSCCPVVRIILNEKQVYLKSLVVAHIYGMLLWAEDLAARKIFLLLF